MKKQSEAPPVYLQIAYDIAGKIASGEIKEGQKITGRSLLSSQYKVSPETIRRSMRLLSDMGIISIQQNVGSIVVSRQHSIEYVDQYKSDHDLSLLKKHLKDLTKQREILNEEINTTFHRIIDLEERFRHSDQFRMYEFSLCENSRVIGKSIGNLKFRQETGGTIVAVRRESKTYLSPDPEMSLNPGDVLVIACNLTDICRVSDFLGYPADQE